MRSTYIAQKVEVKTGVKGVAVDIPIAGRPFMIANTGAQPLYINPAETATAANGFLIPAGTVLPIKMTVSGNLSAISNTTGTDVAVLYFDV